MKVIKAFVKKIVNMVASLFPKKFEWLLLAQKGEFLSQSRDKWRQSDAFMKQTVELLTHWGYACRDFKDSIIVDIGAGAKLRSKFFEKAKIVAIEPLASKFIDKVPWTDLKNCWRLYSSPAEMFIRDLEEKADFVMCINVLDHTFDPLAILQNAFRYLTPGGEMLLSVDLHKDRDPIHPVKLTEGRLNEMLQCIRFKIKRTYNGLLSSKAYGHGMTYTLVLEKEQFLKHKSKIL